MPLPATTRRSLVDQAIDGMRGLLDNGEWTVGGRIPPEPVLAASLQVSRNTVREAVRALAHAGVLDVRRGDGTYVAASSEVAAVVGRHAEGADFDHVLEVRHAIETQAAVLAAQRRTAADLRALEGALDRRTRAFAAGDAPGFVSADLEFHLGVVSAAHNPLMRELYDGFVGRVRSTVALPPDGNDDLCGDHQALLAAVRDRDAQGAAEATGGLLRRAARQRR